MQFKVTTNGKDELGIRELVQRYANEFWLPDHVTTDQGNKKVSSTVLADQASFLGLPRGELWTQAHVSLPFLLSTFHRHTACLD